MGDYIAVLLPSIGVGLIFWFVMRALFRADRGERRAQEAVQRDQADAEKWYQDLKARESGGRDSADSVSDDLPESPRS
jgi:hypothetical protein